MVERNLWWGQHKDVWVAKLTECVESDEPLGVGHVLALLNDLTSLSPFAEGTFVTEQAIDTVARWKAEVLREALKKALTWESRLNEAEQMSSQGIPIEPTKIKIAVNAERNAAIAILEETKNESD